MISGNHSCWLLDSVDLILPTALPVFVYVEGGHLVFLDERRLHGGDITLQIGLLVDMELDVAGLHLRDTSGTRSKPR
jgi:hypothetical protein